MKQYQHFYIQKSSQAFDETLLTFGLAAVIQNLFGDDSGLEQMISDKGAYYELALNMPLDEALVIAESPRLMPRRALATKKTKLPEGIATHQYEEIREQVNAFHELRKQGNDEAVFPPEPWDVYRAINPAALLGYNKLMSDWFRVSDTPEALLILLDLYADLPNDVDRAIQQWKALDKKRGWKIKPETTRQSLYNPDSGKGQNKPKADGLSISNVKSFWLSEWLKAVGFYEVALTKQLRGAKDRKTLVLAPRQFTFERHQRVMTEFKTAMQVSETSIRFDVLASLRYTGILLDHTLEQITKRRRAINLKKELVTGFHTVFYKHMGNAVATMNLSFIALPSWVIVEAPDDVPVYRAVLDELEDIVSQFNESHSEDVTLLQHLRDFISGDDLSAFLKFTDALPSYLMKERQRGNYRVKQLKQSFIERLIMNTNDDFTDIISNGGFRNIASAIRHATMLAQIRSNSNKYPNYPYQVRYGLHHDLLRKSTYPGEFIAELSDFIAKYSAETNRVYELALKKANGEPKAVRIDGRRYNPSQEDIQDVVKLIAKYDSKSVAKLLIACGTSSLGKRNENDEETNQQENE